MVVRLYRWDVESIIEEFELEEMTEDQVSFFVQRHEHELEKVTKQFFREQIYKRLLDNQGVL
jgi:hypothetical protein|tara:strand:- start:1822 stop:2007 length:186 start_codon:yes stop_codon:yes gene_type:complete